MNDDEETEKVDIELPEYAHTEFSEDVVIYLLELYKNDFDRDDIFFRVDTLNDIENIKENLEDKEDLEGGYFIISEAIYGSECVVYFVGDDSYTAESILREVNIFISNITTNISSSTKSDYSALEISEGGGGGFVLSLG